MKNEIAFKSCENCMEVARILVEEANVVLISREEDLWILNFVYSEHSDRNDVVFMSQEEFYEQQLEEQNDDVEDGCATTEKETERKTMEIFQAEKMEGAEQ